MKASKLVNFLAAIVKLVSDKIAPSESKLRFLCYCHRRNVVGLRTNTPFRYDDFGLREPLRVSLYNGVSVSDAERLVQVMAGFAREYARTRAVRVDRGDLGNFSDLPITSNFG